MRVFCVVVVCFILVPMPGQAQHLEIGGFASYGNFDIPRFPSTAVGVGGRIDINLNSYLVLEGEGSYDFKHPRVEIVSTGANSFQVSTLKLGVIHGNGGLKLQLKGGSYFLFLKGGVLTFQPEVRTNTLVGVLITNPPPTGTDFSEAVFYPGAGIGFHAGPLGIRLDAGDEIYWDNGTHHNLRITFGPTFRF